MGPDGPCRGAFRTDQQTDAEQAGQLEELAELIWIEEGFAQDSCQCPLLDGLAGMDRDGEGGHCAVRLRSTHLNVAAPLPDHNEAGSVEGTKEITTGDLREPSHPLAPQAPFG